MNLPSPCLFNLTSHFTYLQIQGESALSFLQGQLTCDINEVTPSTTRQGALCNLKGRILVLLDLLLWNQNAGFCIAQNLLPIMQKDLKLIAQLSRVTFQSIPCQIMGLYAPEAHHPNTLPFQLPVTRHECIYTDDLFCYALDKDLFILISLDPLHQWTSSFSLQEEKHWHALLLSRGLASIHPETSAQFLPAQLDLDKTSTVSFKKGCYKGQEIIARMHYKGMNKYELRSVVVPKEKKYFPGMKLQSTELGTGEVIDVAPIDMSNDLILITVLKS